MDSRSRSQSRSRTPAAGADDDGSKDASSTSLDSQGKPKKPSSSAAAGAAAATTGRGKRDKDAHASSSSSSARQSQSQSQQAAHRKGPPPEPAFDLVAAKQLCMTTDEALSGMTDGELRAHVAKLEAMRGIAGEVLVYWQQRTDEKIGDREAFEGVIENLVKHARKVRK